MTEREFEQLDIVRTTSGRRTLQWLISDLEEQRRAGRRIVTTNGCFDLIHPGHIAFLEEARKLGDLLLVFLNTDNSLRGLKGAGRPIVHEEDRAAILLGLRSVDYVVLFDDLLPLNMLARIRPDVHCKAGDYVAEELPETPVVLQYGGEVRILPFLRGYSSSRIIERILANAAAVEEGSLQLGSESTEEVCRALLAGSNVLRQTAYHLRTRVIQVADIFATAIKTGHKILVCGNGGSAADAQHFAAELVGRYRNERQPLPAIALTVDTSVLTAVGNDYGFEHIFSRQVAALGFEGDVLLAISASGKSVNVINAVNMANRRGLRTIGLSGGMDSPLSRSVHCNLQVPASDIPLIQQAHIAILHVLCELLERRL